MIPLETAPDLAALANYLEGQGHKVDTHDDPIFGPGFTIIDDKDTSLMIWVRRSSETGKWYIQPMTDTRYTLIDPAEPNSIEQVEEIIQQCQTTSSKP